MKSRVYIDGRHASFWLCGTIELVFVFVMLGEKTMYKERRVRDKGHANEKKHAISVLQRTKPHMRDKALKVILQTFLCSLQKAQLAGFDPSYNATSQCRSLNQFIEVGGARLREKSKVESKCNRSLGGNTIGARRRLGCLRW